jgi:hypothetical protein
MVPPYTIKRLRTQIVMVRRVEAADVYSDVHYLHAGRERRP